MLVLDALFVASARKFELLPPPAFVEVAFAGRSNVGKSSLINRLLNRRKLARTSNTPGCTRGIDLFRVRLRDATLDIIDLPGYGYAKRSKSERHAWGPLIDGYLRSRESLKAVSVIVDIRRGVQDDDRQLLDFLAYLNRRAIVVATKMDKLPRNRQKPLLKQLQKEIAYPVYGFSAVTGAGREALLTALLEEALEIAGAGG
ncbi:MAG: YihA family ribosome biogenesis GTP-binding protein [Deltaproteobacteria bacterium]|nr:YihA family ribosome biogenesis GTP-binding protein [Deltaproteobacteria bacterium]